MTPHAAIPTQRPPNQPAAVFDAFHAARSETSLINDLYAEAMGQDYPAEVAANSSCDWPLLGLITARLRLSPGHHLIDAGCGTGGIGLWLARALSTRVTGIDISSVAIAAATARSGHFLPSERATFRVATLVDTGLDDGCAAGVVCVDALSFAEQTTALHELARILAPGARLVLTRATHHGAQPAWEHHAQAAGLNVECIDERPSEPSMWERLYRLWIEHAEDLRREVGDEQAHTMLGKAHQHLPILSRRRAVLLTLRRPTAATMPFRPDHDGPGGTWS